MVLIDHKRSRIVANKGSALVTNLGQKEGGAVVKVHVALAVEAAPAVLQHVIHTEHVHGLVILEEGMGVSDTTLRADGHHRTHRGVLAGLMRNPANLMALVALKHQERVDTHGSVKDLIVANRGAQIPADVEGQVSVTGAFVSLNWSNKDTVINGPVAERRARRLCCPRRVCELHTLKRIQPENESTSCNPGRSSSLSTPHTQGRTFECSRG